MSQQCKALDYKKNIALSIWAMLTDHMMYPGNSSVPAKHLTNDLV